MSGEGGDTNAVDKYFNRFISVEDGWGENNLDVEEMHQPLSSTIRRSRNTSHHKIIDKSIVPQFTSYSDSMSLHTMQIICNKVRYCFFGRKEQGSPAWRNN